MAAAALAALAVAWPAGPALAEPLKPVAEKIVRAATFEIVVPRIPESAAMQYERPLPWDQVPFSIRNDPYISIGTAFAIAPNEFVTAAHVLAAWTGSLYGQPKLRAPDGEVHEFDQVLKFSGHEDFGVFSVQNPPALQPLSVNASPAMNTEVHAVGNALGEGVVIRDGLLTSETPEQQDGRWHWYRFSAAASPGNSGGPLVDSSGRIIGVIVAASPAENLNFALPIRRVLEAPAGLGRVDMRTNFELPIMPFSVSDTIRYEFGLPLGLAEFSGRLQAEWNAHLDRLRAKLVAEHADRLFPKGSPSERTLLRVRGSDWPRLIRYGDDGEWSPQELSNWTEASLPNGGEVRAGAIAGAALVRVRRPENQPLAGLLADSKLQMDLAIKGLAWGRIIGTQGVRILSLGPADRDERHVDAYGRVWQLRTWPLAPIDQKGILFVLPVPDGFVALGRLVPTGQVHAAVEDLKIFANLMDVTYRGSLAQWREYFALQGQKPKVFDGIRVAFEANKQFSYRSPRFEVSYGTGIIDINERSNLALVFGYFRERGAVAWDVTEFRFSEDLASPMSVVVRRMARVTAELGGPMYTDWQRMMRKEAPYNGRPYLDKNVPSVRSIVGAPPVPPATPEAEPARMYEVAIVQGGMYGSAAEMSAMQESLLAKFRLLE